MRARIQADGMKAFPSLTTVLITLVSSSCQQWHTPQKSSKNLLGEIYQLKILAKSIQTIKQNETRFVIVERHQNSSAKINKASLKFMLDHTRGSLAARLNVMSDCKLNLTKIQSLPKIDTPWKYAFFVDVTFDTYEDYEKAKTIMTIMAEEFKVLGEYKNAKQ